MPKRWRDGCPDEPQVKLEQSPSPRRASGPHLHEGVIVIKERDPSKGAPKGHLRSYTAYLNKCVKKRRLLEEKIARREAEKRASAPQPKAPGPGPSARIAAHKEARAQAFSRRSELLQKAAAASSSSSSSLSQPCSDSKRSNPGAVSGCCKVSHRARRSNSDVRGSEARSSGD
jgi:hypothetical protein